jgi:hypothetical protein
VGIGVMLGCFLSVVLRVKSVSSSDLGMMSRFLVVAFFVVLCRLAMMLRGKLVMFRSFVMVLGALMFGHFSSAPLWIHPAISRNGCKILERAQGMTWPAVQCAARS